MRPSHRPVWLPSSLTTPNGSSDWLDTPMENVSRRMAISVGETRSSMRLLAGTPQMPPQPFSGARTHVPSSRVILSVIGICCAAAGAASSSASSGTVSAVSCRVTVMADMLTTAGDVH